VKSHAHSAIIRALDREILHLLRAALTSTDIKHRHRRRCGPIPRRKGIDHLPAGLEIDHARVSVLGLHLGYLLAGGEVDFDEVVDADVGDEARAGGFGDGGPAGGFLVVEFCCCDRGGEVG
jgi:hypothetical protein